MEIPTAQEMFNRITEGLKQGLTVWICTATRQTKITPKVAKSWEDSGDKLFKVVKNDLYIASGRKWNCLMANDHLLVAIHIRDEG